MAFTYNDSLLDARSRVRFAVGDITDPGLFPDATYDAQWALTAVRRATFAATADDDTLRVAGLAYADGDAAVLVALYDAIGLDTGAIRYVVGVDTIAETFQLALTPGGAALDIEADGAGVIGILDEAAATRQIASGLAATFAIEPDSISSDGSSLSWRERVASWTRIATGEAGGASASVGRGFRLRRGAAIDYTTGGGDAN